MVGSPFEEAQAQDHDEGDTEAKQDGLPPESIKIAAQRRMALGNLGALLRKVRVVQFLDLLRDAEDGIAARHDVTPEEAGALHDLFGRCPVEQRIERLP